MYVACFVVKSCVPDCVCFHDFPGGLTNQLQADPSLLVGFQRKLINLLVFEDTNPDLLDEAADALLSLIQTGEEQFRELAKELLGYALHDSYVEPLTQAFDRLLVLETSRLSGRGVRELPNSVINNEIKHAFRANLTQFVSEVRCYLRMK